MEKRTFKFLLEIEAEVDGPMSDEVMERVFVDIVDSIPNVLGANEDDGEQTLILVDAVSVEHIVCDDGKGE